MLREHWTDYGIDLKYGEKLDVHSIFGNRGDQDVERSGRRPLIIDVGFGRGESLVHMAVNNSQNDYIGVEIHRSGIAQCLGDLVRERISNVRLIRADATTLFENYLPEASLEEVHVFS